jgi:hypothetical protein
MKVQTSGGVVEVEVREVPDAVEAAAEGVEVDVEAAGGFAEGAVFVEVDAEGFDEGGAAASIVGDERGKKAARETEEFVLVFAAEEDAVEAEFFEGNGLIVTAETVGDVESAAGLGVADGEIVEGTADPADGDGGGRAREHADRLTAEFFGESAGATGESTGDRSGRVEDDDAFTLNSDDPAGEELADAAADDLEEFLVGGDGVVGTRGGAE